MTVKRLPNILTLLRMPGAAALIGLDANWAAFWIVYALCGLSDILDGLLARRLHAESLLWERLDSAADSLFVIASAGRLLPLCDFPLWGWIGGVALAHVAVMLPARGLRHTRLNRLCGLVWRLSMPPIVAASGRRFRRACWPQLRLCRMCAS